MNAFSTAALLIALTASDPSARAETSTTQVAAVNAPVWNSSCRDIECLMVVDIAHGLPDDIANLKLSISINPNTKMVNFVSFGIPGYADRGRNFALSFADSKKDAAGNWKLEMALDATRVLDVSNCTKFACLIYLPNGMTPTTSSENGLNITQYMLNNRLMMFFYFKNGKRVEVATPLYAFQEKYAALTGPSPK